MPINYPTLSNIVARIRSDVRKLLPNTDPTVFGSFIRSFTDSNANRHYDSVLLIQQLEKELFPQTSSGEALERWAGYEGLTRLPSTGSQGSIVMTGTAPSTIPIGTSLRSVDGNLYTTQGSINIANVALSITSLVRSGTTATATTASDHGLATGINAVIAGANETDYNGTFLITVLSSNTFSYEIIGSPTTPATGIITASADVAVVVVQSDDFGSDKNIESGGELVLVTPISGVDTNGYTDINGVTGGTDEETDANLLVRTKQNRSNPVANFNSAAIAKQILSVSGVTRYKIKRITPYIGAVTILFVRDGDTNIIPDAGEVQDVLDAVLEITPVNSDEADVFVIAPTPVVTNFNFTTILPDTPTMRTAITESLDALFKDEVTFEVDVTEDKYRSAIIDTVDPETGTILQSFTLSSPVGDIPVTTNGIATLGTVNY